MPGGSWYRSLGGMRPARTERGPVRIRRVERETTTLAEWWVEMLVAGCWQRRDFWFDGERNVDDVAARYRARGYHVTVTKGNQP